MTHAEYVEAVAQRLGHYELVTHVGEEEYFSWSQCDGCGSTLGGTRHDAVGIEKVGPNATEPDELRICTDCLGYITYGALPGESWS